MGTTNVDLEHFATTETDQDFLEDSLRIQDVWGFKIAMYLFLGGLAGGAYVIGYVATAMALPSTVLELSILIAVLSLGIGMLHLIADLEVKSRAWRVFLQVEDSWIARGAWIITAFFSLSTVQGLLLAGGWMVVGDAGFYVLGGVTSILGISVAAYTGMLLSESKPIKFWSFPMLPVVFTVSGVSTGVMSLILLLPIYESAIGRAVSEDALWWLSLADMILLVLLGVVLAGFLTGETEFVSKKMARHSWLRGDLSRQFWGFVVGLEIVVPFLIEAATVTAGIPHSVLAAGMIGGLVGGFWLRKLVLDAGYYEPLQGSRLKGSWSNGERRQKPSFADQLKKK